MDKNRLRSSVEGVASTALPLEGPFAELLASGAPEVLIQATRAPSSRQRRREGEAPTALPLEGATRAPSDRAVTLLSGGIDSYLSTALARAEHEIALALTFDYGQRAAAQEVRAAQKMAKFWRVKHQVVELPWLKNLGENALTHGRARLPQFRSPEKLSDRKATERSAEAVWVPNRNGVFINIAASFAETLGATRILTGFNREEAATFPDNGSDYVHRMNRALEFSTLFFPPKVKSYVQEMNKKEMVAQLVTMDLPIDFFWSCYEGGGVGANKGGAKMCGTCESCARTVAAFKENGLWQKIEYRF